MKRFVVFLAVLAAVKVFALDNVPTPTDGSFYDGRVHQAAREALSNSVWAAMSARVDTNATTTVTNYVPRRAGDVLIGADGGTDSVWIAKSLLPSGWLKVK